MRVLVDQHWMRKALELARRGSGQTSPNPMVGACLVQGDRLISSGFHAAFGGIHAELAALRGAGRKAKGATLYVTLEPCSTYGKTAPCTDAVLGAGIKRVVIGTLDPNPEHHGRGVFLLRKKGVRVELGVLKKEAEMLIEAFSKWVRQGIPFVTLKMAQSLDGKIASRTGESRWISGAAARHWVHELRAAHDAILVGKNTLLRDDPRLTVCNGTPLTLPSPLTGERVRVRGKEPWRMVLDAKGECSPTARIFRAGGPTALVCAQQFVRSVFRKFSGSKVTIIPVLARAGKINLRALLHELGLMGITSLLVEGGGELAWSFIEEGLVDKMAWIIAPKIIGGREAKTSVEGSGVKSLGTALRIRKSRVISLGEDLLIEGYLKD